MNKKNAIYWCIVAAAILTIVCVLFFGFILPKINAKKSDTTTVVLSSKATKEYFNVTVDEFMNTKLWIYESCEDFRHRAKIDKDNNLVLQLTQDQIDTWKNLYGKVDLDKLDGTGIEVTNDFKNIRFVGWRNGAYMEVLSLAHRFQIEQLVAGVDFDKVSVHVVMIDAGTNNIVVDATVPGDKIKISSIDFSPKPTE